MATTINKDNFDETVRLADDFFQCVNGGWLARNPIPADESRWGSFNVLRFDVERQIQVIIDDLVAADVASLDADAARVRMFYSMGMDVAGRNRVGIQPLSETFRMIDAIATNDDLAKALASLHRIGVHAWWAPFAAQDEKQSEVIALQLYQAGLGLPDRDYYLNEDEKSRKIRADYFVYIKDVLAILGYGERTEDAARRITALETALAMASLTRVELRDVEKQYNKMSVPELSALAPRAHWSEYFSALGLPVDEPKYVIVGQPKFFAEADRLLETTPLDVIRDYLRWCVINRAAPYLMEDLERRAFDFYGRTFRGAPEMKPLARRVLAATNDALDEILGKLYVARHFPEEAKNKMNVLVDHLIAAYEARIRKLDWMSDTTKEKAIEKLRTVSRKLGYPDVWKDMSALEVREDSYVENVLRAYAFEFDRKMREVGGPVNRNEWFMPPQMVNAYYQPSLNEIAFPAGILQPPFFDLAADDAENFGGIGTTIGHELTHGLDDQGALFDAQGNLKNWWTAEDKARFDKKAARLAEQFDAYESLPGLHVNGKLTLGENIADLGGVLIALNGLKLALGENQQAAEKIDGLTPMQRFFVSYAMTERESTREELVRLLIQTDPHSPGKFRVNGPLSNIKEFYEAFGVAQGDALWRKPEDRVGIW